MKIDIHTHTKKCKSGDAPTREISPENFCEAVLSTDVKIIAITNHNVFDLIQYNDIDSRIGAQAQVWPGIELDILENGARGHLLVIVSQKRAKDFSVAVNALIKEAHPDSFTTTIDSVLRSFDALKPLYVAHYKQKRPNLTDDALGRLLAGAANPRCVIKEVTNAISAGIYISHGYSSIYGSDLHDWAQYEELSRDLPELRLPVDSFEHFCLLLEKDTTTINTVLDRKSSEELVLRPFDDGSTLTLRVFNDINVVFGPKGTGKSCILRAIAQHYAENGIDAKVYESASGRLNEIFDTKGDDVTINLNDYGINYCTNEINGLRTAAEVGVTSLVKYAAYFTARSTNRNAKKILIKDIEPEEEARAKRDFLDSHKAVETTDDFLTFLSESNSVKRELTKEEYQEITRLLSVMLSRLKGREWLTFTKWKEICLLNSAVDVFRKEIERKTGAPAKPTTAGFRDYATNRIEIQANADEIVKCVDTRIPLLHESVGNLGSNKGELEVRTEFCFQTGQVAGSSLSSRKGVKKGTQKDFINCVRRISKHACADDLFQHIAKLNEIDDIEDVKTVNELLLFRKYFALNDVPYEPSSGEASMVMLQKELGTDRDVYILDEPEKSLGNEYISDVIVPLLRDRARAGKKIFISTHDANIAVRTLPYSSIYRCHGSEGYTTYIGNPFSNNLINLEDSTDHLDWKKVSMKTLEGGEEAFGERGKIYGND